MTRIALACARLSLEGERESNGLEGDYCSKPVVGLSRDQSVYADADSADMTTRLIMEVLACESGVQVA
jgi:hypothetical protein